MAKRLEEFDVLKGIGILLVVLGHCKIGDMLSRIIFSFHMPLFIMVSGFFYYRQPPIAFLRKTTMRLLVPWLFFAGLNILYEFARNYGDIPDLRAAIVETFRMITPLDEECDLLYRSIWFLVALFIVGNVYNLIRHVLSRFNMDGGRVLDGVVLVTYVIGYLLQLHLDLPFYLDTAISMILFYHLGSVVRSLLPRVDMGSIWMSPWLSLLSFVALMCIPALALMPDVAIKTNDFPWWLPIFEIPVFIALYNMVSWLCKQAALLPVRKLFVDCGKYSICFLGFHRIFLDAIYVVYGGFPRMSDAVNIIIYFVVLIPLVLWLSRFLEKHAPVLIGSKRKG